MGNSSDIRQDVIDTILEPVVAIDSDYNVIFMNRAAAKTYGVCASDAGSVKCYQVSHRRSSPCSGESHACPLEEVRRTGKPVTVTHRHFVPSGEQRSMEVCASPLPAPDGIFRGIVEWVRDITEFKRKEHENEVISTVTISLRNAKSRCDIVPIILKLITNMVMVKSAAFMLKDPANGKMCVEQAQGGWASLNGKIIRASAEDITHTILEAHPQTHFICNDVQYDPLFAGNGLFEGIRAAAVFPLITHDMVMGAILIARNKAFTNEDAKLIGAIGDISANAIHRTNILAQTEQRLQRLSALREIDIAISGSMDIRVTLNVFLDQVISKLHIDAADVLLMNPYNYTLEYCAGRGFRKSRIEETRQRTGEGTAGRAAQERSTMKISDLRRVGDGFDRSWMIKEENFITYFAVPLVCAAKVKGVLEIFHRSPLDPDQEWLDFMQSLAVQAAIAIDHSSMFNELYDSNVELSLAYESTLESWSHIMDVRDHITVGHSKRVSEMTLRIAHHFGIREEEQVHVRRGALLHDIGKIAIPDSVLLKQDELSEEEWRIMRLHPIHAYKMLSSIDYLRKSLHIPLCHHEKWDGTGYPHGLMAEQIPLAARIFSVVDVWDALRSDRPYRPGWPEEKVRSFIVSRAGKDFDPKVVQTFVEVVPAS